MRILFFSTFFDFRGEPTNLADEVMAVTSHHPNIEYLIYTVGPYNNKNQVIRYSKNILLIERKELKSPKVFLLFLKDIITIFTKFKPDIIHSVYVLESLIMGIFGNIFRVPSILHGRGTDVNYFPFRKTKSFFLAKLAFKLNKKIITVSKSMKKDVIKLKVPKDKIVPIYDGLNFSDFTSKQIDKNEKNNKFEIIHANRFSPEKNQDLIIEVCKELRDNNIDFHFTFIGYGPLEKDLNDLIKKYNLEKWVTMGGFVEHVKVHEYLEQADLYVQPSTSEGMPKSVYEAMYMELPVVMTNTGGMAELNLKPGVILIGKEIKKELYDGIIWFMNHPKERIIGGKKNREFIIKNFNWDLHVKKLYNVYLELINKKQ